MDPKAVLLLLIPLHGVVGPVRLKNRGYLTSTKLMSEYKEISKLVYINLDYREDRKLHMLDQLAGCKWPFERLSATKLEVDPAEVGLKMIPRLEGRRGVASIWLSHQRALKHLVDSSRDSDGGLVLLEDDVVVKREFWLPRFKLPAQLPEDWELLLLTPKYRWRNESDIPPEELGRNFAKAPNGGRPFPTQLALKSYIVSGAHFCVFRSRAAAQKILDRMAAVGEIYDVDLFYASECKCYGVRNRHVSSGGFGSDHN